MTSCAVTAFKALNGIFSVYKPPYLGKAALTEMIKKNLAQGLNEMEVRPVASRVVIGGSLSKGENLTVNLVTNYADHPLVVGPRYQIKDIKLVLVNHLDWFSSGVIPVGIGPSGCFNAFRLKKSNPIRCYELTGRLGYATESFDSSGEVREKSTYGHITRGRLESFLSRVEANHQSLIWTTVNVDIKSQEAYELASKGLLKPKQSKNMPIIYSVKCLEFDLPYFTIQVQCVNEWPTYLKRFIHDIGIGLKSNATCTRLRCTRFGTYNVDDSLLPFHVNLENIVNLLEYFDPKQGKLVRPMIDQSLTNDLDIDYDEYSSDNHEEEMKDLESMTFKFEKDADGWIDDRSDLTDDRI